MVDPRHFVLIAYGILALLAVTLAIAPPKNSGEVAAWVQGVGTVVAVLVAAWIGFLPARLEARRAEKARHDFLRSIKLATRILVSHHKALRRAIKYQDLEELIREVDFIELYRTKRLFESLLLTGAQAWPTFSLYEEVNGLMGALASFEAEAKDFQLDLQKRRTAFGSVDSSDEQDSNFGSWWDENWTMISMTLHVVETSLEEVKDLLALELQQ